MKIVAAFMSSSGQLITKFSSDEYGIFDSFTAIKELGFEFIAHPIKAAVISVSGSYIEWPSIAYIDKHPYWATKKVWEKSGKISADYLHQKSELCRQKEIENYWLVISLKNQAPTQMHPTHHVYDVSVNPFADKAIALSESIGGGPGDTGGTRTFTLESLLAFPKWKEHFELSDAAWAIPLLEQKNKSNEDILLELVNQAPAQKLKKMMNAK